MGDKGRDEPGVLGYIGGGQGKRPAVWSDPTFAHSTRTTSLEITALSYDKAHSKFSEAGDLGSVGRIVGILTDNSDHHYAPS